MKKLTIFDDGKKAGTIFQSGDQIYNFARSTIDWRELNRLVYYGYKVKPNHPKFLEYVAKQAHEYNFSS